MSPSPVSGMLASTPSSTTAGVIGPEDTNRTAMTIAAAASLATGLALVPLVVRGDIPGQEIEYPLAIVILGGLVASGLTIADLEALQEEVATSREAAREAERLRGRLDRRPAVVSQLEDARARVDDATGRVTTLLDKVKALGFDPAALTASRAARDETLETAVARLRSLCE